MATMEITTIIGCGLMCNICPQTSLIKNYKSVKKQLSLNDYKTMIDKIPKHVRIDFSGMSEPWSNLECTDMFEYTLQSNFKVSIYSTLYGMTTDQTNRVIELIKKYKYQISEFYIHLPDKDMNMRGWKNNENYEYALKNINGLDDETKSIIGFRLMTMHPKSLIHDDIKHLNMNLSNDWHAITRAGNLKISEKIESFTEKTPVHNYRVSCGVANFYDRNVMLPNGDILICCMDYSMKHIIGNLLTDSYDDLYLSENMIHLMKENKKNCYSENSLCKTCHNAKKWPVETIYETFS